jgi:aspartyl-tRNA synthetase
MNRTHLCGELGKDEMGEKVTLDGWVKRTRDLGGLLFVDMRDVSGTVQVTFNIENKDLYEAAKRLRMEDVIEVEGVLRARDQKNINPEMKTGEIEVEALSLKILNRSEVPPFVVDDAESASEELRFKYRYLDLRRNKIRDNFILRSRTILATRNYFAQRGFIDIETPILIKSTPEGARDYIVPSRIHKGRFYALPQSPQIFKQILMIAGFDRYIQIPKCFRDEDQRADRQPEFTQIDLEMSFVEEEDIYEITEGLLVELWGLIGVTVDTPFPRLTWHTAMERFGSDRPDLRFDLELRDITVEAEKTGLNMFSLQGSDNKVTKALVVPGCADWSRKMLDDLTETAKKSGAKGLLWIKVEETGVRSSILKQLGEEGTIKLAGAAGAKEGDLVLIVSDEFLTACTVLGTLRNKVADELGLKNHNEYRFLWVCDFPLFEWSEEEERYVSSHHPFTQPKVDDIEKLKTSPADVLSRAYDVICNGIELGGGSIRIHQRDLQRKVFSALGIDNQEAERKFGFLLEALKYGAPPHGGIALGMDRIVAILAGEKSIRDVIAFPKTTSALCLMTDSPAEVDEKTLRELGIKIIKSKE